MELCEFFFTYLVENLSWRLLSLCFVSLSWQGGQLPFQLSGFSLTLQRNVPALTMSVVDVLSALRVYTADHLFCLDFGNKTHTRFFVVSTYMA